MHVAVRVLIFFSTSNFCRLLNVNWVMIQEKILNLVSKLEEKDEAIKTFMLSAEQLAEVKRKEMYQESEKQEVQAVDVALQRSNGIYNIKNCPKYDPQSLLLLP